MLLVGLIFDQNCAVKGVEDHLVTWERTVVERA